ncbi:MAG: GNAT family N-acetyltransferase [Clostridia bacterium]
MIERKATLNDVELLVKSRKLQLIDEGEPPCIGIDDELSAFFSSKIADGTLIQYILEKNGEMLATGGILYMDFPPSGTNSTGKVGYVANIYTKPQYRRKRYAIKILGLLKQDAQSKKVQEMRLVASKTGVFVYEKFGFSIAERWMEMSI